MDQQLYEIQDGVRRAKAAWLCGLETIEAQIDGRGEVITIPLIWLRSPKAAIEDYGSRGADWGVIYRATQRGARLPPIVIVAGLQGTPIADVEVQADELELFRQRYSSNT
jgi:hypothetical protein